MTAKRGKSLVTVLVPIASLPLLAGVFLLLRPSITTLAAEPFEPSVAYAVVSAAALNPDPILETHADTLTTYRGGKTKVQDAKPRVDQRGVNLDGSLREGGSLSMAIAGNPFERYWNGEAKQNGVRLDTGTWAPMEVDLALPAPGFRWIVGRTYNARADNSGQYDSAGPQGSNWAQSSAPEIVYYSYGPDHAYDAIYLVWGADRYAEFKRTGSSSTEFKGKNGAAGVFQKSAGSPDTYAFTDQNGSVFTFLGFNTSSNTYDGQLWKIADPAGNVAYVGDSSSASTAITNGFDASGRITKAYDSADRRYTYTYNADTPPHLSQVKAETKTGGTWASPSGLATVGTVDYTYYGNESYGDSGDLKSATVTLPLTDSGVNDIRKTYYRYWEGTYNASTNPGYPHALQLVISAEGVRQYDWSDSTFDDDQFTASLSSLKPYASAYFEYDTSHRINLAWFSGQCGCGGGAGTGTHEYSYGTNGSYTDNSGYDQTWARRTVVKRPDNAYVTQAFDETGQALSRILTDGDPTGSPSKWVTSVSRDTRGCVDQIATPSSVTGYTHSTGAITLSSSAGLVRTFTRSGSGDSIGFCLDVRSKTGTSGSAYYEQSFGFDVSTSTKTVGAVVVVRPLQTDLYEYPTATTTQYSGANRTQYAYTTYSGSSQPLAVEEITITPPAVTTGNNGRNASDPRSVHRKTDGTVDYKSQSDGTYRIVEKLAYTNGQVTTKIEDADTTGGGVPTNFVSTAPGSYLAFTTTTAFDAQGRTNTVTAPDGDVSLNYYSVLSDRRMIVIQYPKYVSGSTTVYGPAKFSVMNQAGKAEVEGTIAISSGSTSSSLTSLVDETQSDPIAAIDVGTVAQMTVKLYDEPGTQLESQRSYFAIPASLPGSPASSYYDTTTFGYDDMGRQRRTKTADGTISRTVFDAIGRVSAHWTGLNDYSFAGGESSGPDDMVKTDDQVFDGGSADGNSYVTKVTRYIQDSGTGKRETSFANDVRGNVLLVTNATAPHQLNKYDNQNRRIATGSYSTAPSSSSDPTSTTSNRLALTQSFYDELGRVWKAQRHQIDASDGSDDDNLQDLKWWDRMGRLAKEDGEQLMKWSYDRLGRRRHAYTLANDNDSTYANAVDDTTGDHVAVQDDTVYDTSSNNVILSGRIERYHSDLSSTGPMDSEADGLPLKYTAANLAGRIQITASWYDALDRIQDRVSLGTNGASDYNRSGASAPTRSDTELRTTYVYNDDGTLKDVQDPKGFTTRTTYDAMGRRTKVVANYSDGTPGGGTYADQDQTVSYAYTNGLQTSITADLPSPETDQVTTYTFGVTKGSGLGASTMASGRLVKTIAYPDSSGGSDVVTLQYNAQGQEIYKKDQGGNEIETIYDDSGRTTGKKVTTLGSGFDGAIRYIGTAYDGLGRRETVTQYSNSAGSTVIDQVKYTYDSWGQVSKFEQDRDSTVAGGGNQYTVQWTWGKNTSGRNTLKLGDETWPSGKVYTMSYRSAGGLLDLDASRVTQIKDGNTALVTYDYNGLDQVVGTYDEEPDVMRRFYPTTPNGTYPDLDNFNRVTTDKWTKDLSTDKNFWNVAVGWDRNSNVTYQDDQVHTGVDALYTNDDLNRLVRSYEGTYSAGSISSAKRDQQWTLTQVGDWTYDKLDLNGDADFVDSSEWNDHRTHNDVNEILTRDLDNNSGTGGDNYTLTHDAAGDLTNDGKDYKYEWDAFYRLRYVKTQASAVVAEYKYNGLNYRIAEHTDTDNDLDVDGNDKWYRSAFDDRWRVVATFRESDTSPKEQYVYHNAGLEGRGTGSYIDLVAWRDKDANTAWTSASDGTLEERIYYCQNWRADVSALVTVTGTMLQWDKYSAYGVPYGVPGGDTNTDFMADTGDTNQVQTWINGSVYDVRGDIDLDGDVDATDKSTILGSFVVTILGRESLSSSWNSRRGYAGYMVSAGVMDQYDVRQRTYAAGLGKWISRDPMEPSQDSTLYGYVQENPLANADAFGLCAGGCISPSTPSAGTHCSTTNIQPDAKSDPVQCGWLWQKLPVGGMPVPIYWKIVRDGPVLASGEGEVDCPGPCRYTNITLGLRFQVKTGDGNWQDVPPSGPLYNYWHSNGGLTWTHPPGASTLHAAPPGGSSRPIWTLPHLGIFCLREDAPNCVTLTFVATAPSPNTACQVTFQQDMCCTRCN